MALPALVAVLLGAALWFGIGPTIFSESPPVAPIQVQPEPVQPEPVQPEVARPFILTAKETISVGTLLLDTHLEWREARELSPTATGTLIQGAVPLRAVIGAIATRSLEPGDPILWSGLRLREHPGYIGASLRPDMVAMTIRVQDTANVVHPGDRVDVILVGPSGTEATVAHTILHDARVLAVGSSVVSFAHYGVLDGISEFVSEPPQLTPGGGYTLEVTPQDAERMAMAARIGSLTLAIRSPYTGKRFPPRAPMTLDQVVPLVPTVQIGRVIRGVNETPGRVKGL